MTRARTAEALSEKIRASGFTPSVKDLPAIVVLSTGGNEDVFPHAIRALKQLPREAVAAIVASIQGTAAQSAAEGSARGHAYKVLGRLSEHVEPDSEAVRVLIAGVRDKDSWAARQAIIALGKFRSPEVEDVLIQAWGDSPSIEHRRSLAASLGKIGSEKASLLLRDADDQGDAELQRILGRAKLIVTRTMVREGSSSGLDSDLRAGHPFDVLVFCRQGLEDIVADELSGFAAAPAFPGILRAKLTGTLREFLHRTRCATHFAFNLPREPLRIGEKDGAAAVARALTSTAARDVFSTWTRGQVRFRIAWRKGGHQRALVWDIARRVSEIAPELVNDPTESLWTAWVDRKREHVEVALQPRALEDDRFAYRVVDVPAASHPTLAAALARVAGANETDVVWDPFTGSGTELIERARLGPYKSLHGSDQDDAALDKARQNLAAAGVPAELSRCDALEYAPKNVSLIITNPPMGRRVAREKDLSAMLDRFVAHAAQSLVRGGRLVWLAPFPFKSRAVASRCNLALEYAKTVDIGGFDAELQKFVKPLR